ncbi:MAG: VCBS repeat-containing protein [Deltaproteobacteria bacterium]|nr:VCBS repeat-containing protein [Deltaproteobacteria bacterium]
MKKVLNFLFVGLFVISIYIFCTFEVYACPPHNLTPETSLPPDTCTSSAGLSELDEIKYKFSCRHENGWIRDKSEFSNDEGALAWMEAEVVQSYLYMYHADTSRLDYLSEAMRRIDNIMRQRDDIRGVTSYINKKGLSVTLPTWRSLKYSVYLSNSKQCYSRYNEGIGTRYNKLNLDCQQDDCKDDEKFAVPYVVHSALILMPMVIFVQTVDESELHDVSYQGKTTYGIKRDEILKAIKDTVAAHDDEYVEVSGGQEGYYQIRTDVSPYLKPGTQEPGDEPPINQNHAMGSLLARLSNIIDGVSQSERNLYRKRAQQIAMRFKGDLYKNTNDNSFFWNKYSGSYSSKSGSKREDTSHAALSIEFATIAHNQGLVFSHDDMVTFGNTFINHVAICDGHGNYNLNDHIDNPHDGGNRYQWAPARWNLLSQFKPGIFEIAYYFLRRRWVNGNNNMELGYLVKYLSKERNKGILAGFNTESGIRIFKNETGNSVYGDRVRISAGSGATVTSIVLGDTDGDGIKEVFTAVHTSIGTQIYRSDNNDTLGKRIFGPNLNINIASMTAGDVDQDGKDELFVGANTSFGGVIHRTVIN